MPIPDNLQEIRPQSPQISPYDGPIPPGAQDYRVVDIEWLINHFGQGPNHEAIERWKRHFEELQSQRREPYYVIVGGHLSAARKSRHSRERLIIWTPFPSRQPENPLDQLIEWRQLERGRQCDTIEREKFLAEYHNHTRGLPHRYWIYIQGSN